jgi:hypothetical protein
VLHSTGEGLIETTMAYMIRGGGVVVMLLYVVIEIWEGENCLGVEVVCMLEKRFKSVGYVLVFGVKLN